jgi:pimeloyl-ACP methyl ester carboxylesterase
LRILDDELTAHVVANGLRFAIQDHGSPEDDAIVLIRGLGTQMIEWSPVLIETLVRGGLRVVIFDNRDVGLTDKLEESYALGDMAADVVALMEALGITRFHVLGISLGGMVAQLVAVEHGDRVKCLFSVMSSTGNPLLPVAAPEVRERMRMSAADREGQIQLETENREIFGSPGYPESEAGRRALSIRVHDRCHYPAGVERQLRAAIEDGSRVERLGTIALPTLVLHGAQDPLLLPACGEDTARAIPGAEYQCVPGMGHNIPEGLAADIGTRILAFAAKN